MNTQSEVFLHDGVKATASNAAGAPAPHESAALHVSGEAIYVDDLPELQGTLHGALGLSGKAHARVLSMDLDPVRRAPGVVAVLTASDIPGENNCGPIVHDDPVLADGLVQYVGQPVFAVVAESHDAARRAARLACIQYEDLPAQLTPQPAGAEQATVVAPMRMRRGDPEAAIAAAPQRLAGTFSCNGQEQFYLEGQVSYAIPKEGQSLHLHCSTQHPSEMQAVVAHVLGWHAHQLRVECRRMGGGFGGKESQSALFACVAALCATRLNRPVKLRLDRDDDFMITGKRHGFHYDYDVGFDEQGRILGLKLDMSLRAGFSADLSEAVATRAVCHVDNAYYIPHIDVLAVCSKTNTQSNTAFRGFGGPQGALITEVLLDTIARRVGRDPLEVRRVNFYDGQDRNTTPYGQPVLDNVLVPLTDQLVAASAYEARRKAVQEFNRNSQVLKKGLALTPVKFGISFNVPAFNQAGALVHVYRDGSVLVNHGGTEMGQGLNTKVAQVTATELGVNLASVRVTATDTSKVANTSATAASTGSDLNGKAAQDAARRIRCRLAEFAAAHWGGSAADVVFADNAVAVNGQQLPFAQVVDTAYWAQVQLWSEGFYATPGIQWDKHTMTGRPFYYFAYGAAVSEVVIDTLTGEWKLLRADLLHDVGQSINPAIDIGQIEGGFIQGMGWLTTEELCWNNEGKLTTHAPSTYKIPAVGDCPADFRVALFHNQNIKDTVHRSKAVGEPPLLLSFSVFNAIRDAVVSAQGNGNEPQLNAPATPEAILDALSGLPGRSTA
ncbi:xanthine dehydrogenase molybdopterin binding subunit [Pollutimonas harenae]|uniref:Xanthine dehydrogenase molybdopterin binding subunit n=1 Tax=Pollutimonas harenae TaxID=657015 RepID=A0A853GQW9_9BURK|nr:xanthine dehydrogenase molybdopterin binding subunit [Pollutimonas harenae]NYT84551.1 xanthine dehydrogenase molybdopterin binding subunit [Pollutimonas harenae]TEA73056.1 xanthine dehydrogenase molybdopterin binding subunit [Pollutimonas harenae]